MNLYSAIPRKASQLCSVHYREQDRLQCAPKDTVADSRFTHFDRQWIPDGRTPTEKVRRPSVLRRYRGTIKRCRLTDLRCRQATSATGVPQLTRYLGALFFRHRRTMAAILYSTRSGTLSQRTWSWISVDWLVKHAPQNYRDGVLYGENFIIITSTVFDWITRIINGRRDRQTEGRTAIAYSAPYMLYAVAR